MTLYPRRRFLRYMIYFVCFSLVLTALDMLWAYLRRTIHPRYDTTRIVEPTLPDGSIDYLAGIEQYFSRGVTPENNAVPLIFEALGRIALPKTQPEDGITSRLGMPHLPEKGDYFIDFATFTKARDGKAGELPIDTAESPESTPATPPDMSTIRAWLSANEKPLALIQKASTRTRYWIPFNGGNRPELVCSVLLPHINAMRDVTHALPLRARLRSEAGDLAGARQDAITLHRFARLLGQAPLLVERLVAIAAETRTCDADRQIIAGGKWSAQDLRNYASELAEMPDLESPAAPVDVGERSMILDVTQHFAKLSPMEAGKLYRAVSNDGAAPASVLFPFLPIPYEQTMIDTNAWYDGLITAFRQPSYPQRREALSRWEKGINEVSRNSYIGICSADWALRLFMPSLSRFAARWETARD